MALMRAFLDGRESVGGTPLLMHNDRLADPLDPFSLEIGKISKKRSKTEVDHLEISRLEFFGCLYTAPQIDDPESINGQDPHMPVWNVIRMIQNAGKRHKLGATVLRGMIPAVQAVPIAYKGPRDVTELWNDGSFALRKSVGVGTSRVPRTRPVFTDWRVEADIEVDLTQLNPAKVSQLVEEAGRYEGLGDYRPVYGRFKGWAELVREES